MVDPHNITKFDRSTEELEELILFCLAVAGKKATTTSNCLSKFLKMYKADPSPFSYIKKNWISLSNDSIICDLRSCGFGQQKKLMKGFWQVCRSGIDLKHCSISDLENIHGVGQKTSRFFLLHTRPNQRVAVIDTHINKFLLAQNLIKAKDSYETKEAAFLEVSDKMNVPPEVLDLEVWRHYEGNEPSRIDIGL